MQWKMNIFTDRIYGVWEKAMFPQVLVYSQGGSAFWRGGGGVSGLGGGGWVSRPGVRGWVGVWSEEGGVPSEGGVSSDLMGDGCLVRGGECLVGGGERQTPFPRWLLPRAVRILLECILDDVFHYSASLVILMFIKIRFRNLPWNIFNMESLGDALGPLYCRQETFGTTASWGELFRSQPQFRQGVPGTSWFTDSTGSGISSLK